MSTNPFGDVPPDPYGNNPYAPPPGGIGYGLPQPPPDKDYAKSRLQIPAIVLIVLAALTAILRVGAIVMLLQQAGNAAPPLMVPMLVGHGVPLLLLIAVIAGCLKMLKVESYGSAMTAAIISVVPICSPGLVLGIPFGIWAIVVLNDPRVKASFK